MILGACINDALDPVLVEEIVAINHSLEATRDVPRFGIDGVDLLSWKGEG